MCQITRFPTSKNIPLSGTTDLNLKNLMYLQSLKAHENFKTIPWDNLVSTIPIGARATTLVDVYLLNFAYGYPKV